MRNIVIAVDGSDSSRYALSWAQRLVAAQEDVRFHLVHGRPVQLHYPEVAPHVYTKESDRARAEGTQLLNEVAEGLTGEQVQVHFLSESPAVAVLRVAEQTGANLIAIGRRGLSPTAGLFLGSVSNSVVQGAEAPVLVVHDAPVRSVQRILVGVDGSAGSARALAFAMRWRQNAEVVALYVESGDGDADEIARAVITKMAHKAEVEPNQITMIGRKGNAVDQVLQELKTGDYDLAVVGSRGLGALATVVLGSVSERLTRLASAAVVVVR
jgi:nucleotide-binding universal stress UspA family protein